MPHALIIDDDRSNLGVLAQLLELSSIKYTAIQDPNDVRSILDSKATFDVILLDLEMPDINGYALFKMIKESHLSTVPVVACTVHANQAATARQLGFDSFITKPLNVDTFPEQLSQILSGQAVWQIT